MKAPAQKALDAKKILLRRHWFVKECAQRELPEPVFEHRFDAVRRWRIDIAWPAYRVALEVQGGLFVQGRHTRGAALLKEHEKLNALAAADWVVFYRIPQNLFNPDTFVMLAQAIGTRG